MKVNNIFKLLKLRFFLFTRCFFFEDNPLSFYFISLLFLPVLFLAFASCLLPCFFCLALLPCFLCLALLSLPRRGKGSKAKVQGKAKVPLCFWRTPEAGRRTPASLSKGNLCQRSRPCTFALLPLSPSG